MKEYSLVIRIPVKGFDDVEARQKAKRILGSMLVSKDVKFSYTAKLQKIHKNKQPENIEI